MKAALARLGIRGFNPKLKKAVERHWSDDGAIVLAARPIASFSALFTLWLSMMAALGLASRCACSRHWS